MIDPHDWMIGFCQVRANKEATYVDIDWVRAPVFNGSFTRSNGTLIAKLYERLTKASRRAEQKNLFPGYEETYSEYRRGVYDAYKALQEELA